jgi:transcriptional regulator with XRE-family HTH domain
MPTTRSTEEHILFRRVFADELRRALEDLSLDHRHACQELGISRATLSAWLNEHATPDSALFAKVVVKLELQLDCFQGRIIGLGTGRRTRAQEPSQPLLFPG